MAVLLNIYQMLNLVNVFLKRLLQHQAIRMTRESADAIRMTRVFNNLCTRLLYFNLQRLEGAWICYITLVELKRAASYCLELWVILVYFKYCSIQSPNRLNFIEHTTVERIRRISVYLDISDMHGIWIIQCNMPIVV